MATQVPQRRLGDKSVTDIVRVDELYGHDGLWLGPRGRDYGDKLPHPKPYQHANLYPDQQATYWFAILEMPAASVLTLHGRYPYARYFQLALYRPDPLGSFSATGEALVDHQIRPDRGNTNPYVPGASRLGDDRDYTVRVACTDPPADEAVREPNTLYAGTKGQIALVYRVYTPDAGRDGSGDTGLPGYQATLPDGSQLTAEQVRAQLGRPMTGGVPAGMTPQQWRELMNAPDNDPELQPDTTPARNPPVVERYFNNLYNIAGVFKTPQARAKLPAQAQTGFGGDPKTLFMIAFLSRKFGPVVVVRGTMPQFPNTYLGKNGKGLETMTGWQSRYWSVIMSESPPSGRGGDGLTDMQVPLDTERNYTIVVSRPEDRPQNATEENGIAWMDWGTRGEGIDDPGNREDFGMLLFRFMYNNPNWEHSPDKIMAPGTEAQVMGRYFPRLEYTDKATFETQGAGRA